MDVAHPLWVTFEMCESCNEQKTNPVMRRRLFPHSELCTPYMHDSKAHTAAQIQIEQHGEQSYICQRAQIRTSLSPLEVHSQKNPEGFNLETMTMSKFDPGVLTLATCSCQPPLLEL